MTTKAKKTKRTGTKTTAKRNAGKTAEAFRVPRTARALAAAIQERTARSPDYWNDVKMAMATWETPRAAQVEPREATH